MRAFLILIVLAVGVAIGGAVPRVSQVIQGALAATGLMKTDPPPEGPAQSPKAGAEKPAGEKAEDHAAEGQIKMSAEQAAAQEITTAPVQGGTLSRHLMAPGTITPDTDRIARVPARVVGTVAEMLKRLGDPVKKGEVVAVLDSREVADAKSEYLTALVNTELQKTNYDRQQALWDKRISAEATFLQARATYSETQLRVNLARQKLSALGLNADEVAAAAKKDETTPNQSSLRRYELRSPLTGRVVERKVDVGTAVGKEGDPADLYTVADLATVWVELAVPTTDLAKVKEGAEVLIAARDEDAGQRAKGKIIFVSPLLNAETRSARVIAALPNQDFSWRPGTFVSAEIQVGQDSAKAKVPRDALQSMGGEKVAFVRNADGFERRDVKTGKSDDESVEVVSGLEPGEEIAVKNTFLLKAELGKGEAEHHD
ncbi:cobalt-zinc-cadmium efflux system membrane fusion protein [Methylobacterium brachiatum]|uniref:Cobalt-zinc-cadmium efflux system membrane fusion protein n=1 Tax=Methylobacterium brachiatum TaxID=269660 RepID=A0AAJ1U3A7_9HYPH|nr:efflux RND transporter periplasmic adaptor subunit [Methylobacterium brachiatum]MCB4806327.1 efflux RND transporter periplasmic adaptor subunit [Methylobacterium brachiatum]MDQ0547248.1 cobalt-zinc-cadmium efflux system membrane fusion protein [Methylobacterium brachiatum]